jgi:ABC-2 type transport system permease protein
VKRAARQIWAVYRRELAAYFYSPIAYVVAALFLVGEGLSFYALVRALADPAAPAPYGAVLRRFFGGSALYWAFTLNAPAVLTMRLIAEERHKGTLEALLTAPTSEARVTLGKYFAALTFYCLLWLPTVLYVVVLRRYAPPGEHPDWGPIASAYLGVVVTGAGFLGVGLLASALTRHQLVAAVATYVTLTGILLAGTLPDVDFEVGWAERPPWIYRLLSYVDLRRHMDDFARGVIDLRWIVLYLSVAAAGVALATLVTQRRKAR